MIFQTEAQRSKQASNKNQQQLQLRTNAVEKRREEKKRDAIQKLNTRLLFYNSHSRVQFLYSLRKYIQCTIEF